MPEAVQPVTAHDGRAKSRGRVLFDQLSVASSSCRSASANKTNCDKGLVLLPENQLATVEQLHKRMSSNVARTEGTSFRCVPGSTCPAAVDR